MCPRFIRCQEGQPRSRSSPLSCASPRRWPGRQEPLRPVPRVSVIGFDPAVNLQPSDLGSDQTGVAEVGDQVSGVLAEGVEKLPGSHDPEDAPTDATSAAQAGRAAFGQRRVGGHGEVAGGAGMGRTV